MHTDTHTPLRIATVEEVISKAASVSIEDMRSHKRIKQYAEARMAVWFIAHDHLNFSYMTIARVYRRDHTTVMSGVRKIRDSKVKDRVLDGIKKTCPEVLEKPAPGEARMAENWRF